MRCPPSRSKRSPRGRSKGGTPHGAEGYHTGGVRGRGSSSGAGTGGGGVGGGGGTGTHGRGRPVAAGARGRDAAGDVGGGVDRAQRATGSTGTLRLWRGAAVSSASALASAYGAAGAGRP